MEMKNKRKKIKENFPGEEDEEDADDQDDDDENENETEIDNRNDVGLKSILFLVIPILQRLLPGLVRLG